jgi:hypothetical protein
VIKLLLLQKDTIKVEKEQLEDIVHHKADRERNDVQKK